MVSILTAIRDNEPLPAIFYGHALGPPAQGVQIPVLTRQAKTSGVVRYIGRGLNRWSNVHIADVAALYQSAPAKAPSGTFIYVESGEEALGQIAKAIAANLVSARPNLGMPMTLLQLGGGTWRSSCSAPTVACGAKSLRNSAGHPRGGRSRAGSPRTSSHAHDRLGKQARAKDAGAPPRCYRDVTGSC
jgi:nucleoside-diphosphate-sugar epimerase